ncbi:hypothetical protein Tco_1569838 [Tanacetum coccineum]
MIHIEFNAWYEILKKETRTKISELEECVRIKDRQHIIRASDDFIIFENLRAQVQELKSENEHLKSKVVDFITFQTLQVQVTKLKSENEGLKFDELTKACEIVEATLRQRYKLISAQCGDCWKNNLSHFISSNFKIKNLELVKEIGDKVKCFDEEKRAFETKISKLKMVLAQRVKDFDDVKTELSKRTDKFQTYFANLEKQNALLKWQLVSQNYSSLQKKNNDLRTSYNVLKDKYETSCEKT